MVPRWETIGYEQAIGYFFALFVRQPDDVINHLLPSS